MIEVKRGPNEVLGHFSLCFSLLTCKYREFPGGPVVRTSGFHCQGHGFNPWSKIHQAVLHGQKKKSANSK